MPRGRRRERTAQHLVVVGIDRFDEVGAPREGQAAERCEGGHTRTGEVGVYVTHPPSTGMRRVPSTGAGQDAA